MPRLIDKEEKKTLILTAAVQTIAQKGVNVKMSEIAEAAGIGKSTIYEYFSNKDEILHESFKFFMSYADTMVNQASSGKASPQEYLNAFFDSWTAILDSPTAEYFDAMLHFWAIGIMQNQDTSLFDLKSIYHNYRAQFTQLFDICFAGSCPYDPEVLASILIAELDGLMLQYILDRNSFDLKAALGTLRSLYLNLIDSAGVS